MDYPSYPEYTRYRPRCCELPIGVGETKLRPLVCGCADGRIWVDFPKNDENKTQLDQDVV